MRAVKLLLILAMTCALFGAQGIAISESEATPPPLRHILEIGLEINPDEIVQAGDVTVAFTIVNNSQYSANNIYYTCADGLHTERLGQMAPGESQVFTRTYSVSDAELEAGQIAITITHDDIAGGDEPVDYEVSAPIKRADVAPALEFTRHIPSQIVSKDSTVTITYRLRNVGNVPLSQLELNDKLGDFTGSLEVLECGEEKVFTNRVVATGEMVSVASVKYAVPSVDDETHEEKLSDVKIEIAEPSLSATLVLDRSVASPGDTVNGVVTIAAEGADFVDVYVTDDVNGTLLADSYEIRAGNSITVSCSWSVRVPSDYRLRIFGRCVTGEIYEITTNTENVQLSGEFSESILDISATAATEDIKRAGKVRITIAIENFGNSPAQGVVLKEKTLGELRCFAFIPVGDPTYREIMVDVYEDSVFEFSVCITDELGAEQTVASVEVPIEVSADGVEPEAEIEKENEVFSDFTGWIARNFNDDATYLWMLAVASGLLVILIIIALVSHGREYFKFHRRRARVQFRRRDDSARRSRKASKPQKSPKK